MRYPRLISTLIATALAASVGSAALAQAPAPPPATPSPAHPPATAATPGQPQAAPAPPPEARIVRPREVTVISGSRFRIGKETFQVFGVRTPRPRVGQCVYERLRGRQSRATLRRILSRGEIRIAPTGQVNQLGDKMARVWADGQSVARRLVAARAGIVRRPGQNYNPWCLSLRRPPA